MCWAHILCVWFWYALFKGKEAERQRESAREKQQICKHQNLIIGMALWKCISIVFGQRYMNKIADGSEWALNTQWNGLTCVRCVREPERASLNPMNRERNGVKIQIYTHTHTQNRFLLLLLSCIFTISHTHHKIFGYIVRSFSLTLSLSHHWCYILSLHLHRIWSIKIDTVKHSWRYKIFWMFLRGMGGWMDEWVLLYFSFLSLFFSGLRNNTFVSVHFSIRMDSIENGFYFIHVDRISYDQLKTTTSNNLCPTHFIRHARQRGQQRKHIYVWDQCCDMFCKMSASIHTMPNGENQVSIETSVC